MKRITCIVVAISTLIGASCSARAEKATLPAATPGARGVRVTRPVTRIETGLARATGTVRGREDAWLAAKATGQIKRIRVGLGDRVKAGARLVEMDSANAAIAVQNAQAARRLAAANLSAAEKEMARAKVMFEQQSLPEASWDRAVTARDLAAAQLDQATAGLRAAEQMLADTCIAAPFDGVVTGKVKNTGETVTSMPVTPILALTDLDHLEVRLAVPEGIERFVKEGQIVRAVTTPGEQKFDAKVRVKNAVVDPTTRTIEVLADVTRVDGQRLRPGTLVNVDFGGFSEPNAGLFLPTSSVVKDGNGTSILVVVNGKTERRSVEIAAIHPGTVAVKKGVDENTDVVVDPVGLTGGEAVIAVMQ